MFLLIQSEATIVDAEGTEVPVEEVNDSLTQAVVRLSPLSSRAIVTEVSQTQDAPKEAAQAEADATVESPTSDDGTLGQTSEAETEIEQSEKPQAGTPQSDEEAKVTTST
jgi:hypothetical protein